MLHPALTTLSMTKYARLLPRLFPACDTLEVHDCDGAIVWHWQQGGSESGAVQAGGNDIEWADFGHGLERRSMPDGRIQFRGPLASRGKGTIGWLVVGYDTSVSVPMDTAPELLRRSFVDAATFMQEEMDLQVECNQLAAELTERYEELNLVYTTDDRVEHVEDGQRALVQLVRNCTDYLDVGLTALICRDRDLELHDVNRNGAPIRGEVLMQHLRGPVYDRVESQVAPIVLNQEKSPDRSRLLAGRTDNLIAYPVLDDHGKVIGILAVVARKDLHTFSNGDRNLLEVMAKKASRIIHTHHDSLTGLINRGGFESTLVATLNATRSTSIEHCVLYIDIDQLHVVNDLMGHQEGDALIRRVANCLRKRLRDSDCLSRLGGDEFGVLLSHCSLNQGIGIAREILEGIRALDVISASRQLNVSASIGVVSMSGDTDSIVGLLASVEIACKAAKEDGQDGIQVYEPENTKLVRRSEEVEWLGKVQMALREDGFELYSQPVVAIHDKKRAAHFELLLRMVGEDGEILSPGVFLPAAERYQLMPMIDRWVIRNALQCLGRDWKSIAASNPVFCINLSGQSLCNAGFHAFIIDELEASRVPPSNICFEVTETAAIANIDEGITLMKALRKIGCRFSLDDFGAGLSSFGYLRNLPVDYLKIDGSFVRDIRTDGFSRSMVQAICGIGQNMGLSVVAEFVGDEESVAILREIGVDFAQGFGVGKPAPMRETIRELQKARESRTA